MLHILHYLSAMYFCVPCGFLMLHHFISFTFFFSIVRDGTQDLRHTRFFHWVAPLALVHVLLTIKYSTPLFLYLSMFCLWPGSQTNYFQLFSVINKVASKKNSCTLCLWELLWGKDQQTFSANISSFAGYRVSAATTYLCYALWNQLHKWMGKAC
jgi:hypothetical protein